MCIKMCVHKLPQNQTSYGNPPSRKAEQIQEQDWDEVGNGHISRTLTLVDFGEDNLLSAVALAENCEPQ